MQHATKSNQPGLSRSNIFRMQVGPRTKDNKKWEAELGRPGRLRVTSEKQTGDVIDSRLPFGNCFSKRLVFGS